MYRKAYKYFSSSFSQKFRFGSRKAWNHNPFLSFALVSFAAYSTKKYFMIEQSQSKTLREHIKQAYQAQQQMKKIVQIQVCNDQDIKQSQIYPVKVKNQDGTDFTILIIRYGGKLYAVGGECTYRNVLEENQQAKTMQNAICFNDKLMCPHHGCAYDLKSGSVQYGPAPLNLPIFYVNQRAGKVKLSYPQKIPKKVNPKTVTRDYADFRKVLIMGQDHTATVGCIDGLRQYGFDGQISVVLQNNQYPFRKQMLHKSIVNLKLKQKYKKIPTNIDQQIQKLVEQKVYSKLLYHPEKWYEEHGIQFVYNNQPYRIIHKRFYPYVTFFDGTKKQYDGLVLATDVIPVVQKLQGVTINKDNVSLLPENVFMPFRNKNHHLKMLKFLNKNDVKNVIVYGLDQYVLEFLQALRKQFPDIKVQVLDREQQNKLYQIYGQELTHRILKQYTQRNMQFFMKINSQIKTYNKLQNNIQIENIQLKDKKLSPKQVKNSIQIKIGQGENQVKLQGDCLVYFPSQYEGNTANIKKKGKYTDIDFSSEKRIVTQPTQRTDTYRIFSIGTVADNQFFFNRSRMTSFNPNVNYEQGFNSALNLLALNIPFTYIPVEITQHFGKKLYYAGPQSYSNQMIVMGSIEKWDFLILYAKDDKICNAVASESRQKQFQVIRQAFRLQCQPEFSTIINNQWTIPKIYKLIKKLNKSFCYRDEIHKIQDDPVKSNIIWVERKKGSGFANDKPIDQEQTGFEIDERGYIREV